MFLVEIRDGVNYSFAYFVYMGCWIFVFDGVQISPAIVQQCNLLANGWYQFQFVLNMLLYTFFI